MGIFSAALWGAGIGAGVKAWQTGGDMQSIMGGAIAGGLAGGAGRYLGGAALNKVRGGLPISGGLRKGLGWGISRTAGLRRSIGGGMGPMTRGRSMTVGSLRTMGRAMAGARSYIGRNATSVNKYGGYAVGALGAAAAYKIGSSVLGSNNNRGYY